MSRFFWPQCCILISIFLEEGYYFVLLLSFVVICLDADLIAKYEHISIRARYFRRFVNLMIHVRNDKYQFRGSFLLFSSLLTHCLIENRLPFYYYVQLFLETLVCLRLYLESMYIFAIDDKKIAH